MPSATLPNPGLPIFDFSEFQKGDGKASRAAADEIVGAFKKFGFVYLVNHGISKEYISELFDWSRKSFSLPEEVRMDPKNRRPEPGSGSFVARGYAPVGAEKLSQNYQDEDALKKLRNVPDLKDMWEFGPATGPGAEREPNRYPPKEVLPGFEDFMQKMYLDAQGLGLDILRCLAIGLGLAPNYFVDYHQDADNLFRLIRYPACERAAIDAGTAARTSPHTDYGSITILFQDGVGGLEVEDPSKPGTYIKATPVEGAVIVNIGDFLMRWTNDILKSNLHRVVSPPASKDLGGGMEMSMERYSIPYFVQADRHKIVEGAKELEGQGTKYPPISAGEYLAQRTNAAFKK